MKKAVVFGLTAILLAGGPPAFAAQKYSKGDRVKHMGWQYRDPTDETGLGAVIFDTVGLRCGWYGAVIGVPAKDTYKVRIMGFKTNCEEAMASVAETPEEEAEAPETCAMYRDRTVTICSMLNLEGNICSEFYTLNGSHINMEIEVPGDCLELDN